MARANEVRSAAIHNAALRPGFCFIHTACRLIGAVIIDDIFKRFSLSSGILFRSDDRPRRRSAQVAGELSVGPMTRLPLRDGRWPCAGGSSANGHRSFKRNDGPLAVLDARRQSAASLSTRSTASRTTSGLVTTFRGQRRHCEEPQAHAALPGGARRGRLSRQFTFAADLLSSPSAAASLSSRLSAGFSPTLSARWRLCGLSAPIPCSVRSRRSRRDVSGRVCFRCLCCSRSQQTRAQSPAVVQALCVADGRSDGPRVEIPDHARDRASDRRQRTHGPASRRRGADARLQRRPRPVGAVETCEDRLCSEAALLIDADWASECGVAERF
jgi:hypothetical protein